MIKMLKIRNLHSNLNGKLTKEKAIVKSCICEKKKNQRIRNVRDIWTGIWSTRIVE